MLIFDCVSESKISAKFVNELFYSKYLNRELNFTPNLDTNKLIALDEVNGILLILFF